MKYAKVVDGTAVTKPISANSVLIAIKTTVTRNITEDQLLNLFANNQYFPVPAKEEPVIPEALMGKCIVTLGYPQVYTDGSLIRTYEFTEATAEQLARSENANRAKRDFILSRDVDSINAVRWSSMTAEKQAAWTQYRQALLDLTIQPGFPMNITWPVKP